MKLGRLVGWGYLVALAASTGVRWRNPLVAEPDADEKVVTVAAPAGGTPVRIAYRDLGPAAPDGLPVILIHGSPGDNGEVARIARALATTRRAIAPDLPGFGGSTRTIPDYSVRAHAEYVGRLLDSLHIARAHLVGFSMGGGVVINLADQIPRRVASLTLLSAIGGQEYELFGEYHLNHVIHGIQLAGLWGLVNLVPHFGAWDGGDLTIEYARNFYDTDQRPLRGMLTRWQGPALVIQGDKDPLVDPAVARESYRLVPQSEMLMFGDEQANHFMAFQRPDTLAARMAGFFSRAEHGAAVLRATATPDRIEAAARPFNPASVPPIIGIALGLMLLLLAAATFVSEDLACIAAGLLVGRGTIDFLPAAIACAIGIVLGDLWLYGMGRWLGRPALTRVPLRWFLSTDAIDRTSAWFDQRGLAIVLLTRFIPGTRLPTYFTAGVLRTGALRFLGAFLLAAALWTPLLVGASALFGQEILNRFATFQRMAIPGVLAVAVVVAVIFKVLVPLSSWKGRRLLLSRWRRLTRWEFWPRWAFYPPIVVYVVWLAIKHRRLTLFTAVNPAIPGGGFVGESKALILSGLSHAPDRVARWRLIDAADPATRMAALEAFRADSGLAWPVVLKPDVGERGGGVAVMRSAEAARRYLSASAEPVIAQEHVAGVEIGVFYYRIPGEPCGQIFAITDKRFPTVTGDGHATLEHLILADDRAVCLARFLLGHHAAALARVPVAGEVVPLVELGTHSRGSTFLDGEWIRTPALEAAIDDLTRGYHGFWFGRYDLRAPSYQAFQAGRDFKVLELNGATAEATSIYDPGNRIGDAYRVLRRQWAILFEIAGRNAANGAQPATLGGLIALVRIHRRSLRSHVSLRP